MYCFKCKRVTATKDAKLVTTSNRRQLLKGRCKTCNAKKAQFQKKGKKKGSGLLNSAIDKLPVELHIPGYNYCGPGTKLKKRLDRGDVGINALDDACKQHDVAYDRENSLERRHEADKKLASDAVKVIKSKKTGLKEKLAAAGVAAAMKTKVKLGMGVKKKNPWTF